MFSVPSDCSKVFISVGTDVLLKLHQTENKLRVTRLEGGQRVGGKGERNQEVQIPNYKNSHRV